MPVRTGAMAPAGQLPSCQLQLRRPNEATVLMRAHLGLWIEPSASRGAGLRRPDCARKIAIRLQIAIKIAGLPINIGWCSVSGLCCAAAPFVASTLALARNTMKPLGRECGPEIARPYGTTLVSTCTARLAGATAAGAPRLTSRRAAIL